MKNHQKEYTAPNGLGNRLGLSAATGCRVEDTGTGRPSGPLRHSIKKSVCVRVSPWLKTMKIIEGHFKVFTPKKGDLPCASRPTPRALSSPINMDQNGSIRINRFREKCPKPKPIQIR
jgi:hypothetical protein